MWKRIVINHNRQWKEIKEKYGREEKDVGKVTLEAQK